MLLGNIKGKKLAIYYLISSLVTALLSFFFFVILGTFYNATENVILLNVIVWTITVLFAFCVFYFLYFGIKCLSKKDKSYGPLLNGYAIASGFFTILLVCLSRAYKLEDYLYVEVMGYMVGIIALVQIAFTVAGYVKNKKD